MKDINPFALYTGKKFDALNRKATKAIMQGINDCKITVANVNNNPVLEKYRSVGADDSESRSVIAAYIKASKIKPIVVNMVEKRVLSPILNAIVDSDYFDVNRPKGMSKKQCNDAIVSLLKRIDR